MKRFITTLSFTALFLTVLAQFPQMLSYQAVVRNADGKLIQSAPVGIRLSILQGSNTGTVIYSETHLAHTNVNGLVSLEIGNGSPTLGVFSDIPWANGPYFLKTETDPAGGTAYSVVGAQPLLSVPYALYTLKSADAFSGDYNDLSNKPVIDGSETKLHAGSNITVTGSGTTANPYVINGPGAGGSLPGPVTLTSSQTWTVPGGVSKIKVELWGAAGGGGGAGAYSYSYYLNTGGDGGSGGYIREEVAVSPAQQFTVVIGSGGNAGSNAYYSYPSWYGDTDGGNGGDTWFGNWKAAGGTGGKRGSYTTTTVHGAAGTGNVGTVSGYASQSNSNVLDTFLGLVRTFLSDRYYTSKPGKGGIINGYSGGALPKQGESGAAVITFIE
ncbi:MAG TPA: hypothetical protein PKG48_05465 [Bacteroidales bacterium]|nr:hypothetical protein [Bacteroidales bacterium]